VALCCGACCATTGLTVFCVGFGNAFGISGCNSSGFILFCKICGPSKGEEPIISERLNGLGVGSIGLFGYCSGAACDVKRSDIPCDTLLGLSAFNGLANCSGELDMSPRKDLFDSSLSGCPNNF